MGQDRAPVVPAVRRENPTYGKRKKITFILKRDYDTNLSVSAARRIITRPLKQGAIQRSPPAPKVKFLQCRFTKEAKKRCPLDFKYIRVGERTQIDQTGLTGNRHKFYQFQAWERKTKLIHADVFSNVTSSTAKWFLLDIIEKTPFKIKSIQVDGGSELMGEFERVCAGLNLPFFTLQPARPRYNGGVERANRTFREEFYYYYDFTADTIDEIRFELEKTIDKYNTFRLHKNFGRLTLMQYIQNIEAESHPV